MRFGLQMRELPRYQLSGYKAFSPGEKHIDRVCGEDVLLILLSGTLRFSEDGVPVELTAGEYYIQRRGRKQAGIVPSDARYYYIHFFGCFGEEATALPLRGTVDPAPLLPFFDRLDSAQLLRRPLVECSAPFYAILANLNRVQPQTERSRLVGRVLSLVTQNMAVPYSLDDLARLCGYSRNHIINVFKSETGQTPLHYIQDLRMDAARRKLAYSEQSIAGIAEETGFGSYINFYKTFVRKMGCTPQQWRSKQRQSCVIPASQG